MKHETLQNQIKAMTDVFMANEKAVLIKLNLNANKYQLFRVDFNSDDVFFVYDIEMGHEVSKGEPHVLPFHFLSFMTLEYKQVFELYRELR